MKASLRRVLPVMLVAGFANTVAADSLEQVVALTLDSNPEIRADFSLFKASEERVNQARGGYLPQIDLFAQYGVEDADTPGARGRSGGEDGVTFHPRESGVSISQLIFDGFQTSSDVKRLGKEAAADQWTLFANAEDLALRVTEAYLNVIENQALLELAEHNLLTHKSIHEKIRQRAESGLGSSADLAQITGRLARAQSNKVVIFNNLLDAQTQYRTITNIEPKDLVLPYPDHEMLPADMDQALDDTNNHPRIKAAFFDIEAANAEQSVAKGNYYPKVNLSLDSSWGEELGDFEGHSNRMSATVRLDYNLFAGGSDRARYREAAYRIGSAKATRDQAYRDVIEGMRLSWNALRVLREQKSYIRQHVEASKEAQLAYAEQFRLGQRTLLDLLDTENELFEARQDFVTAEMDELLAKYRILNASGKLLASFKVERPEQWNAERDYQ